MQIVVSNLLINYERKGSGKTVILLHGWADSLATFKPLFNELSKKLDVISIDLPGFGASQAPSETWGLGDYADILEKFINKVGVKSVYALIGHSNGGAIAIKAIAGGSVNSEKLVLLSSAGIRGDQKGKLGAIKLLTKTAKVASTPLPSTTKKKLRGKLYKSIGSDYLVNEGMGETFKKIVAEDVRGDASKLNLPTLIVYGEEDDQTPVVYAELYHQLIDDSTLEIITGTGHFLLKDKPETVVKLVRDFLC